MIARRIRGKIESRLAHLPAVALLGPRQVGKTTLALEISESRKSVYLDLESPSDREKLAEAATGAEIDLLLEIPKHGLWAIEIKRGLSAHPEKGFHVACEDLQPSRRFIVNSGLERYPVGPAIEAIGVRALAEILSTI